MNDRIGNFIKRTTARTSLFLIYTLTLVVSHIGLLLFRSNVPNKRIIINGTFHNPNWFFAHIEPIVMSGYGEVILVCDEPVAEIENLIYACPPHWAMKLFTRAGAKAIWTFKMGWQYPSSIYIGYHIFPSAITALVCARCLGGKAVYQITSGQLELEGGGWNSENRLLTALSKPSLIIEKLSLRITRCFDLVVVRGANAKKFVLESGYANSLEIVTGSVNIDKKLIRNERNIDVALVGRLTEYKRADRFIIAMEEVVRKIPDASIKLIGDGPERQTLENLVKKLGLEKNIEFLGQRLDVTRLLGNTKVFVLTSRWEGVSIAMLEAMGLGAVPVVSDVGDLRDFAQNNITGFVYSQDDSQLLSSHVVNLLNDSNLRSKLADTSMKKIEEQCERKILSQRWSTLLFNLTDK